MLPTQADRQGNLARCGPAFCHLLGLLISQEKLSTGPLRKLVPLRLPPLTSQEVPMPFSELSMLTHGDLAALKLALQRKGAKAR